MHASPQKIREIKSLLGNIDDQLKNLRITVKQGLKSQLSLRQEEMRVEVPIGDSGRVIVNRGTKDGVVLESKPGKEVVRRKLSKRKSILDEMNTQIVTTLKGNTGTIFIGQQVPFTTTENFRARNTVSHVQSTHFRDVRTGFKILSQLRKDQVILEISP